MNGTTSGKTGSTGIASAERRHRTKRAARLLNQVLFLLVLVGPVLSIFVPILGSGGEVNISLYEFAMLAVLAVILPSLRGVRIDKLDAALCAVPVLIVLVHSTLVWSLDSGTNEGLLIKETTKYASFFVYTFALSLFMREKINRKDLRRLLPVALLAAIVIGSVNRYLEMHIDLTARENLFAHEIIVLLFLYFCTLTRSPFQMSAAGILGLVSGVALVFLGTKLFIALWVFVAAIWFLIAVGKEPRSASPRSSLPVLAAILITLVCVGIALQLAAPYGRSFALSFESRLPLWQLAIDQIESSFPSGIGLGQFTAAAMAGDVSASPVDVYPHNTPLGMLAELGLAGAIVMLNLLAIAWRSLRRADSVIQVTAAAIILAPMLLHDVLSFRSLQILLAAGLAGLLRDDRASPHLAGDR